jgi:hypothetical protein
MILTRYCCNYNIFWIWQQLKTLWLSCEILTKIWRYKTVKVTYLYSFQQGGFYNHSKHPRSCHNVDLLHFVYIHIDQLLVLLENMNHCWWFLPLYSYNLMVVNCTFWYCMILVLYCVVWSWYSLVWFDLLVVWCGMVYYSSWWYGMR